MNDSNYVTPIKLSMYLETNNKEIILRDKKTGGMFSSQECEDISFKSNNDNKADIHWSVEVSHKSRGFSLDVKVVPKIEGKLLVDLPKRVHAQICDYHIGTVGRTIEEEQEEYIELEFDFEFHGEIKVSTRSDLNCFEDEIYPCDIVLDIKTLEQVSENKFVAKGKGELFF